MESRTNKAQQASDGASLEQVAMQASEVREAAVPTRILLAPWGQVESASGPFVLDEEAAQAAIAKFEAHGADLPVDFEHQTLGGAYASPSGQAPAAGWIKSLSVVTASDASHEGAGRRPGLWADVEWTNEGRDLLARKAYRYISPVVLVRPDTRRVAGIHSVALTNKPAIVGMTPVVNADLNGESTGLIVPTSLAGLREALVMNASEPLDAVLLAATDRIHTLERAASQREAVALVEQVMSEGKLTAAQRTWAIALAERDSEEFRRWAEVAPLVVPLGQTRLHDGSEHHAVNSLNASEAIARSEWREHREFLQKICTEEAYVAGALRGRGDEVPSV